MINSVESFYQRFIFAPCEKAKSLYSYFDKLKVKSKFKNVRISELYDDYRQQTGYSPYEKVSKEEIDDFINGVEPSMYAMA
jgi:iron uptake system EfeUOB component EfeO/EfeM